MNASTNTDFTDMTPEHAEAWLKEFMQKAILDMLLSSKPIQDVDRGFPMLDDLCIEILERNSCQS